MPIMAKDLPLDELLRIISEITHAAAGKRTIPEIADLTTETLQKQFGYLNVSLFLLNGNPKEDLLQGSLYSYSADGLEHEEVQFPLETSSMPGWIYRNKKAKVIKDFQSDMAFLNENVPGAKSEAGFPLIFQGDLDGILLIFSDQPGDFTDQIISTFGLFAGLLATILANAEKLTLLQQDQKSASLLKQYSQNILLAKNEEEVIKYLLAGLATTPFLTGIYSVEKDHLSVLGINDPYAPHAQSSFEGIALPLHNIAERLPQDDILLIEDLSTAIEFRNLASFYSRHEYQSTAIYSIYEIGQLSKIIVISSQAPVTITAEDLPVFDELIKSTRRSLSQFKEIKHLRRQLEELFTLQTVSKAVSAETNLDSLYLVLHQQIIQAIGSDVSFLVATYNNQTETIQVPYLYEDGELQAVEPFPLGEGLTSFLLKNKAPLMVNENAREKFLEMGAKYIGEPSKSWLGIPLIIEEEAVGAIIVQDMHKEKRFSENDLNLLSTIAPHVALALRNAQTFTRMQQAMVALDKESYLLNTLLDNIPERVYFLDQTGKYIRVSQSFAEHLGVSDPSRLIDQAAAGNLAQGLNLETQGTDQTDLESAAPAISVVEQETDKQGSLHWSLNSRIPLVDQDQQVTGLLGLSQNIDALKETEQLAQERAQRLEIAAEIASEASSVLSVEQILNKAVNLVRDRFGYYHASVFQIDPLGEFAILQEAAGDIGAEMKKLGHKLAVGSKSLVGQATKLGVPVVIDDVTADPNYYPNPLLPETRAEMVIPIKIGNRILGALDVQSKEKSAFSPEVVHTLQILSDQLATASSNALLFATTRENLKKNRTLNEVATSAASSSSLQEAVELTASGLKPVMEEADIAIFLYNPENKLEFRAAAGFSGLNLAGLIIESDQGLLGQSSTEGNPIFVADLRSMQNPGTISTKSQSLLLIPFQFSGEPLGMMVMESPKPAAFDQNDLEIMVNFGNMLAAIVSNNRLLEQLRRQADKQQAIFEITNKVRQTVEMQSILQTSVAEICKAVGARRAHIEISTVQEDALHSAERDMTGQEVQQ
jgi:PAS domain S-box-containing protein